MRCATDGRSFASSPWHTSAVRKNAARCVGASAVTLRCIISAIDDREDQQERRLQPHRERVAEDDDLPREHDHERQQVDRERNDPEQRDRRDVGREIRRDREQHARRHEREEHPPHAARDREPFRQPHSRLRSTSRRSHRGLPPWRPRQRCASCSPATTVLKTKRRRTTNAHVAISTASRTYPAVHSSLCCASRSVGSMMTGYASSATMLPRLLAAYRKYGFAADGCPDSLNHRCKQRRAGGQHEERRAERHGEQRREPPHGHLGTVRPPPRRHRHRQR